MLQHGRMLARWTVMPIVRETCFDFDAATGKLVTRSELSVSLRWPDLVGAAVTVGRRSQFDVFRFGFSSRMEVVWRAALLRANLTLHASTWRRTGRFTPSAAFLALDGSEKGAVTYFLGLALAKLAAERRWDVPWVLHLDVYSRRTNPHGRPVTVVPVGTGRRRPDLIGQSKSGDWLVLEAKGRTGHVNDELRLNAKTQTQLISTINGMLPSERIASVAWFRGGALALDLIDPADPLPEAVPLDLPPDDFLSDYYALPLACIEGSEVLRPAEGRQFVTREIGEADFTIGIEEHLYKVLRRGQGSRDTPGNLFARVQDALANLPGMAAGTSGGEERIGPDGVLVQLGPSWRIDTPDG